jgi:hypothetical protein
LAEIDWESRALKAESILARVKAADPELFDTDEDAEDWVYETYGSAGRRLRRDFLKAVNG